MHSWLRSEVEARSAALTDEEWKQVIDKSYAALKIAGIVDSKALQKRCVKNAKKYCRRRFLQNVFNKRKR